MGIALILTTVIIFSLVVWKLLKIEFKNGYNKGCYETRMQIEETYNNLKDGRNGKV